MLYFTPDSPARYGRMTFTAEGLGWTKIEFTAPSGKRESTAFFRRQPARFVYDRHGYERIEASGDEILCARYTPEESGTYSFAAYRGDELAATGTFPVAESSHHGYVRVSDSDRRYFAYTDGTSFVPTGMNLSFPTRYPCSSGSEFGVNGNFAFLGLPQYRKWFRQLRESGCRFVRIWLGHDYFSPDTPDATVLDRKQFEKVEAIVEMAREAGIVLKLTFEQFRQFGADPRTMQPNIYLLFNKSLSLNGVSCQNMTEWLSEPRWKEAWKAKIAEYLLRFGGDPTVFAFEFWNEMNCVTAPLPLVNDWNREMLEALRPLAPKNLWTNSLGSLDCLHVQQNYYESFCWEIFDFIQFHRYLDQGAKFDVCHKSCELGPDGYRILRNIRSDVPILLAETGAVDDCHCGPFRYYGADHRGRIFVDTVYPALFAGCAACGHIWHWDERYVDSKNLFHLLKPLSVLLEGIAIDQEQFQAEDHSTAETYCYLLRGKTVTLGFVRNRTDTWERTLRDDLDPIPVPEVRIPVTGSASLIPIWPDDPVTASSERTELVLQNLHHGTLFCIKR